MTNKQQNIIVISIIILIGFISILVLNVQVPDENNSQIQEQDIQTGSIQIDNVQDEGVYSSETNIITENEAGDKSLDVSSETQTGEIFSSTGGFLSDIGESKNNIHRSQTGTVLIKRTHINKDETDIIKREYEELAYEELFSKNLIKYPEILDHPKLLEKYISFINETRRLRLQDMNMSQYESLWKELYTNNLLFELSSSKDININWKTFSLYTMFPINSEYFQTVKDTNIYDCYYFDSYFNNCMLIIEKGNTLAFIYNLYGKVETIVYLGNKYILNTDTSGDGCGAYKIYNLYSDSGKLINSISQGISGCDASIRSFEKGDIEIEFIYYSDNYEGFQEGMFYEYGVYYKGELKEKILSDVRTYDIDIKKNLFNGDIFDFYIGGINWVQESPRTLEKKETLNKADNIYTQLINNGEGEYSIIGKGSNIQKVSILNCKNNDINQTDEWYTLQKFIPDSDTFTYNISEKFGNYCDGGMYTIKVEYKKYNSDVIVETIGDYRIFF